MGGKVLHGEFKRLGWEIHLGRELTALIGRADLPILYKTSILSNRTAKELTQENVGATKLNLVGRESRGIILDDL